MGDIRITPVDATLLGDLGELFDSSSTTRGCWCMWFLLTNREMDTGWSGRNRDRFEQMTAAETAPVGVLAYDGEHPVGWCAAGPRSRYARALRSLILKTHDPTENDRVWLVPCFFIKAGSRRTGLTELLLTAAMEQATPHHATAIEGFPLAGPGPHRDDRYLGTEFLFAACGFHVVARPSARRVVMRRNLTEPDSPTSPT